MEPNHDGVHKKQGSSIRSRATKIQNFDYSGGAIVASFIFQCRISNEGCHVAWLASKVIHNANRWKLIHKTEKSPMSRLLSKKRWESTRIPDITVPNKPQDVLSDISLATRHHLLIKRLQLGLHQSYSIFWLISHRHFDLFSGNVGFLGLPLIIAKE